MDHIQLLCDIGELNQAFSDTRSIESVLQRTVEMVARHMHTAVCSIYLFDNKSRELVLRATKGLSADSIGRVRLKPGQGLTGIAYKESRPIYERIGRLNPSFKHFPGIDEERYDAFLAVPIILGTTKSGVVVVQREKGKVFNDKDILTLRAVASQLATTIENARLFMSLNGERLPTEETRAPNFKMAKGKVASEGFALGPALVMNREKTMSSLLHRRYAGTFTVEQFRHAVLKTEKQLRDLQVRVEKKLTDVASLIFSAHLLLLKDREFTGAMVRRIESGESAPEAVLNVAKHYLEMLNAAQNAYLREKIHDIEDLTIRLMGNLVDLSDTPFQTKGHVVIARDLYPSELLMLASEGALGAVLVTGGVTSHLSILARSLQLPLIIVDQLRLMDIQNDTNVLLDAEIGNFYINPSKAVISTFQGRNDGRTSVRTHEFSIKSETFTSDHVRIKLLANINLLSDAKLANAMKCEGVGLYRTEFPFLIRSDFPSEEEQYAVYQKLVERIQGKPVTFRTLDIGGDKTLSYHDSNREPNPFLGLRSIRFSLSNREIFSQQIRAMLRAGTGAELRISFPMVASMEEFLEAKELVAECIRDLKARRVRHNSHPALGAMIEVPSALAILDELARESDFFSVGTNDLVQYLLAVDRTNEKVASLYIPHHPAVLRAIKTIVDAASRYNRPVSVCGDMAQSAKYLQFLVGVGIKELSVDASYIPRVQEAISRLSYVESAKIAQKALTMYKASDIAKILK